MRFLVIHGPNLNMLKARDKTHYGDLSIEELNSFIKDFCKEKSVKVKFFQSNFEGKIINKLHAAKCDCVILNAGAFTHYSYAIRDAIECIKPKVIEVHLSDISKREDFRKVSVIKDVCIHSIAGKGKHSYTEAIEYFFEREKNGKD
ncbi:MAG: 3-dehydroquinate dehydratase [Firmicutes bacterium]|nr:3-dehydroquinate dehydratase [Bacillota bacterium]